MKVLPLRWPRTKRILQRRWAHLWRYLTVTSQRGHSPPSSRADISAVPLPLLIPVRRRGSDLRNRFRDDPRASPLALAALSKVTLHSRSGGGTGGGALQMPRDGSEWSRPELEKGKRGLVCELRMCLDGGVEVMNWKKSVWVVIGKLVGCGVWLICVPLKVSYAYCRQIELSEFMSSSRIMWLRWMQAELRNRILSNVS